MNVNKKDFAIMSIMKYFAEADKNISGIDYKAMSNVSESMAEVEITEEYRGLYLWEQVQNIKSGEIGIFINRHSDNDELIDVLNEEHTIFGTEESDWKSTGLIVDWSMVMDSALMEIDDRPKVAKVTIIER